MALSGDFGLDVVFGIDIGDLLAGKPLSQVFFIRNPVVNATGTLTGTDAAAQLTVHVALSDPKTIADDNRIDIAELTDLSLSNVTGSVDVLLAAQNINAGL